MPRFNILVLLAICAVLFVLTELFFVPKTYINSAILTAMQAPRAFFSSLANQRDLIKQLREAQLENQSLRAELLAAQNAPGLVREGRITRLRVPLYSEYPLNNAGLAIIAAGTAEGVSQKMIVEAAPKVFFGQVIEAHEHQSIVRTLYDPGWELPVRVGPEKVDSLLVGGHQPRLTLISKKKSPTAGMSVYLADKQYPYGLLLGSMGDPADSDKNLFQEADLVLPYRVNDIDNVFILLP